MAKDPHIIILSELVSSQIAAGEVVERPASVVKELIENSLDAEASCITIKINDAGKALISVEDNGTGIPGDELRLAVTRHATSKLEKTEDLEDIRTLGFRGEALASIGSVSQMQISSRHKTESIGTRLHCSGGSIKNLEKIPLTIGTSVRVEKLFFNLPARLKFLKHDQTETNLINELIQKYAIEYAHVQFKYSVNGKCLFTTLGKGDMSDGLIHLYGVDLQKQMLPLNSQETAVEIKGFISPLSLTKSNRKGITFFVNGRWVQDTGMVSTFLHAYQSMLMIGRFPFCFLSLRVPPQDVDVNVHPAKSQIRIKNSETVLSFIHCEVKKRITQASLIPQIRFLNWQIAASRTDWNDAPLSSGGNDQYLEDRKPFSNNSINASLKQDEMIKIPILRAIGQIGLVYIVAEGPDGLYLVDQHAAHERILFEKYLKPDDQSFPSQNLFEKVILELTADKAVQLRKYLKQLQFFGFFIEDFGDTSFIIRAVPQSTQNKDPKDMLLSILDENDNESNLLVLTNQNLFIARICKKMAIKGGQSLTLEEQRKLLEDLEKCENPKSCPHGRKTMIHLPIDLLEKQFGRRGSV